MPFRQSCTAYNDMMCLAKQYTTPCCTQAFPIVNKLRKDCLATDNQMMSHAGRAPRARSVA